MGTNSFTNYKFKNYIDITIHETIHVLGFTSLAMQYWVDSATGNYYAATYKSKIMKTVTIRGISTNILFSKNVLATARKYYGCSSMEGM